MDVVEALLPYTNATDIFLQISKMFPYYTILIASFNVLHKPFITIYQLFSFWILVYETPLEAKLVVLPSPSFFP
jgi:hypothetical protein